MAKRSRRVIEQRARVDASRAYPLPEAVGLLKQVWVQDLERRRRPVAHLSSAEHAAERPAAEQGLDLVVTDLAPGPKHRRRVVRA